ncbi:MAG: DNA-directed RNA polymerase subunit alpha [Candidatus Magasanikbacteria bacterium CG10_big_fil_rev_8_21_14_0_10_47_10]|uniref:DNA-directed RNA polymerase subunit alpha n=1 Tax=Candidatus Magasanikbacteria bacterium CG10_big_fil_rev_8_21_14_0_10_47_10 TaxID=1974652 RepID=A0A2H0TQK3_9BACT|nr:MAG: DNA-directed RNA polymerase subunit alpha [Candidatus Magasanikbacteria bacterium CG10_big_fil_rev_8_21_14_0_10_47_10]
MEHILLPDAITFETTDKPNVGRLILSPCQQGYGTTLGNALRRVLLSSLPGAAVESVRINGVQHEFSAVEGVSEDMVQIILNLKQLAVISHVDAPVTLHIKKKGKGLITAADFEKNSDVEIVNPDLTLCTVTDAGTNIEMDVMIGKGRGYVSVSEKETKDLDLGTIMIDSLYTPIRDVGYKVENTRVGDVTDYEKLVMTIETNGTMTPKESVEQATRILMDHFAVILDMHEQNDMSEDKADETNDEVAEEEEMTDVAS